MIRVAITGPESTGKSTLAAQLAQHFQAPWVPEYARTYLNQLSRPYEALDLEAIAREQLAFWQEEAAKNPPLLFLDTELLVLKIWSEHAYGTTSAFILEELRRQPVDLYLLMNIDLPWQPDPQREHPHLRQFFYDWYKRELEQLGVPYVEISGSADERLRNAIRAVQQVVSSPTKPLS
ncbi:AAA family ATPase [Rufibacter sediminis]|uniref:ATP-binding protein n=1 Tax=Rufibacter sediminis TaxID=2762756 RepID=A0ABR6VY15_9BACT|nr:ATP-binding protein [Rufibacter sediminis]MBC3542036.1 ATP-binding protein [Rufibacter sediminis]